MGVGLLYHLALGGWRDVVLLEKAELTSGSTWHAAGQCPLFNGSLNLTKVHKYGTELYPRLGQLTGHQVSWHPCGGLRLATTDEEVLWVGYDSTRAPTTIWTYWHGSVLHTEWRDKGAPAVDVQWGKHGSLPHRVVRSRPLPAPEAKTLAEFAKGSAGREVSTTMAFSVMLRNLLRDKSVGQRVVPIIPDEARTFGLDAIFPTAKIYSPHGQEYEAVDRDLLLSYKESKTGQILHEGISEAGSTASLARTAHASAFRCT